LQNKDLRLKKHNNFGRGFVSSADLCYNEANGKASPFGRGGGEADGEGKMEQEPLKKNNELLNVARILRRNMTRHEKHLWYDFLRYFR